MRNPYMKFQILAYMMWHASKSMTDAQPKSNMPPNKEEFIMVLVWNKNLFHL